MRRLREVLERVVPPGAVEAGHVLAAWRQVARSMGKEVHPADFRSGCLTVYAPTAGEAQVLSLEASEIKRAINARVGAGVVQRVRVRALSE